MMLGDNTRSGCGPGAKLDAPTAHERIPTSEYARRLARGLQLAADAAMELAVRMERKAETVEFCGACGKPTKAPFRVDGKMLCNQCASSDGYF